MGCPGLSAMDPINHQQNINMAAKKTTGRKRGRTPKWKTPNAMKEAIDEYFQKCESAHQHPTMAGMAIYLGFASVKGLWKYRQRSEAYDDVIERAKTVIEDHRNQMLLEAKNPAGIIFDLKNNFGWKDRYENTHKVDIDLSTLTEEQLEYMAETGQLPPELR